MNSEEKLEPDLIYLSSNPGCRNSLLLILPPAECYSFMWEDLHPFHDIKYSVALHFVKFYGSTFPLPLPHQYLLWQRVWHMIHRIDWMEIYPVSVPEGFLCMKWKGLSVSCYDLMTVMHSCVPDILWWLEVRQRCWSTFWKPGWMDGIALPWIQVVGDEFPMPGIVTPSLKSSSWRTSSSCRSISCYKS